MTRSWMIVCVALVGVLVGCKGSPQLVQPASRGQRGEACQARNDCASGLACVGGVCSKNDFRITVAAKQCDRIDCSVDQDCCGDRPLMAPTKCANRESICATPYLAGCTAFQTCTSTATCGTGTCGAGRCSYDFSNCNVPADCAVDTCLLANGFGQCTVSRNPCNTTADCVSNTCTNRRCDCDNPLYDPSNVICDDPDCTNICTLRCSDERCVPDTSCEMDSDCASRGLQHCEAKKCVECLTASEATDCTGEGEICRDGGCVVPCKVNEECPLFHQCTDGNCVETGCTSDRECVLALSTGGSSQDARLSKCLPSEADPTINICKIPCENDAACPNDFEVCSAGFCTFIGCENNEECRAYLGLADEQITPQKPYVSHAECRLAVTP